MYNEQNFIQAISVSFQKYQEFGARSTQKLKPLFCVGLKFVTSNYKQNANNYFESMMGETANIQANKGLPYAHVIVLRYETPYYKKDGSIGKIEVLNEKDLSKYLKLAFDTKQAHKPYAMGILLIAIDEATAAVTVVDPASFLSKEFAELFENKMSIRTLRTKISSL